MNDTEQTAPIDAGLAYAETLTEDIILGLGGRPLDIAVTRALGWVPRGPSASHHWYLEDADGCAQTVMAKIIPYYGNGVAKPDCVYDALSPNWVSRSETSWNMLRHVMNECNVVRIETTKQFGVFVCTIEGRFTASGAGQATVIARSYLLARRFMAVNKARERREAEERARVERERAQAEQSKQREQANNGRYRLADMPEFKNKYYPTGAVVRYMDRSYIRTTAPYSNLQHFECPEFSIHWWQIPVVVAEAILVEYREQHKASEERRVTGLLWGTYPGS